MLHQNKLRPQRNVCKDLHDEPSVRPPTHFPLKKDLIVVHSKYKGSKIDWDVDECDQPMEVVKKAHPKPQQAPASKKLPVNMRNRFATLRLDDEDDDETDDKFDTSSEFLASSTVNVTA